MVLIHPAIDPVIISFGILQIRWYGLAYVLGFIIGIYLIKKINISSINKISNTKIDKFFIWSVLGVIIGGRVGYVIFYQTETIFSNFLSIFYIWQGGMSFHGGLLGIIISIFLFARKNQIDFLHLSDFVSLVAPIGIFFGRIANFINVELYGRVTEFPLAIIYPTIDNSPRHPSQLYEAFFEGIILFFILFYFRNKISITKQYGLITSLFLFYYGIFRFIIEFLREPDNHLGFFFNFLTMGQLLSVPLIIIGIFIYFNLKKIND
tara:strand:- start:1566 stop:2357 length:792 start_codon:yes stop_codon:yes gene_type:complete